MRKGKLTALWLYAVLLVSMISACGNQQKSEKEKQLPSSALPGTPDSVAQQNIGGAAQNTSTDEQKFRTAFAAFQQAVQGNNEELVRKFIHFPLQTGKQWTNDDLKSTEVDKVAGRISADDFKQYYPNIFHADVKRLLPKVGEDDLLEIDDKMNEDYYKILQQVADKDSKLYEVYKQYPEKNGTAESYFAFVFGRVDGEYKVVAYYAKWPVKG